MRFIRAIHPENKQSFHGYLEGDQVVGLSEAPYAGVSLSGERFPLSSLTLLPPCEPSKIVAGGANYRSHLAELGLPIPEKPVFFHKPASSLIATGAPINYPEQTKQLEFEAELAVVMATPLFQATPEQAQAAIFGYTIANDVTARDIQFQDNSLMHMSHAKSFDTFCPCGPWIKTGDIDTSNLEFRTTVNGERLQVSNTSDMIFSIAEMVSYFSHIMTLNPGDLVLTGTPTTSGGLEIGDEVSIVIEDIGTLTNIVQRL